VTGRVTCYNAPLSGVVFAATQGKMRALLITHHYPLAASYILDNAALRGGAGRRPHDNRPESESSDD
jgi:hypothetical protein